MVPTGVELRYVWLVLTATNRETSVSHLIVLSALELCTHLQFLKLLGNFASGTTKHMMTGWDSATEMPCVFYL
jgi:hypothetical protein